MTFFRRCIARACSLYYDYNCVPGLEIAKTSALESLKIIEGENARLSEKIGQENAKRRVLQQFYSASDPEVLAAGFAEQLRFYIDAVVEVCGLEHLLLKRKFLKTPGVLGLLVGGGMLGALNKVMAGTTPSGGTTGTIGGGVSASVSATLAGGEHLGLGTAGAAAEHQQLQFGRTFTLPTDQRLQSQQDILNPASSLSRRLQEETLFRWVSLQLWELRARCSSLSHQLWDFPFLRTRCKIFANIGKRVESLADLRDPVLWLGLSLILLAKSVCGVGGGAAGGRRGDVFVSNPRGGTAIVDVVRGGGVPRGTGIISKDGGKEAGGRGAEDLHGGKSVSEGAGASEHSAQESSAPDEKDRRICRNARDSSEEDSDEENPHLVPTLRILGAQDESPPSDEGAFASEARRYEEFAAGVQQGEDADGGTPSSSGSPVGPKNLISTPRGVTGRKLSRAAVHPPSRPSSARRGDLLHHGTSTTGRASRASVRGTTVRLMMPSKERGGTPRPTAGDDHEDEEDQKQGGRNASKNTSKNPGAGKSGPQISTAAHGGGYQPARNTNAASARVPASARGPSRISEEDERFVLFILKRAWVLDQKDPTSRGRAALGFIRGLLNTISSMSSSGVVEKGCGPTLAEFTAFFEASDLAGGGRRGSAETIQNSSGSTSIVAGGGTNVSSMTMGAVSPTINLPGGGVSSRPGSSTALDHGSHDGGGGGGAKSRPVPPTPQEIQRAQLLDDSMQLLLWRLFLGCPGLETWVSTGGTFGTAGRADWLGDRNEALVKKLFPEPASENTGKRPKKAGAAFGNPPSSPGTRKSPASGGSSPTTGTTAGVGFAPRTAPESPVNATAHGASPSSSNGEQSPSAAKTLTLSGIGPGLSLSSLNEEQQQLLGEIIDDKLQDGEDPCQDLSLLLGAEESLHDLTAMSVEHFLLRWLKHQCSTFGTGTGRYHLLPKFFFQPHGRSHSRPHRRIFLPSSCVEFFYRHVLIPGTSTGQVQRERSEGKKRMPMPVGGRASFSPSPGLFGGSASGRGDARHDPEGPPVHEVGGLMPIPENFSQDLMDGRLLFKLSRTLTASTYLRKVRVAGEQNLQESSAQNKLPKKRVSVFEQSSRTTSSRTPGGLVLLPAPGGGPPPRLSSRLDNVSEDHAAEGVPTGGAVGLSSSFSPGGVGVGGSGLTLPAAMSTNAMRRSLLFTSGAGIDHPSLVTSTSSSPSSYRRSTIIIGNQGGSANPLDSRKDTVLMHSPIDFILLTVERFLPEFFPFFSAEALLRGQADLLCALCAGLFLWNPNLAMREADRKYAERFVFFARNFAPRAAGFVAGNLFVPTTHGSCARNSVARYWLLPSCGGMRCCPGTTRFFTRRTGCVRC